MFASFSLWSTISAAVSQAVDASTAKSLSSVSKELWAVIFLLSGGMSLLILKEVFSFLKSRKTNGKAQESATGTYSPIISADEVRAHFKESACTATQIDSIESAMLKLTECTTKQTIILDTLTSSFSRHEESQRLAAVATALANSKK